MENTEEEKMLRDMEEQCSNLSNEIIETMCKRIIRAINKWPSDALAYADDFPSNFNFFDILSVDYQTMSWDEINPELLDSIENLVSIMYKELPIKEQFFMEYSECYTLNRSLNSQEIESAIMDKFVEMLNNHYATSKKIEYFELKKVGENA